ncbi:MAG: hypothetical protein QOG80_3467, partial [Pseudonocardiales bacterium]|nr:hypothetical protein [Pseudonocardiales bacterium]
MAGVVHGRSLPSGDVCFLFADVESSTALLREIGAARWAPLQEQMQRIVRTAVEANGGAVVNTEGDGCFAAFDSAAGAVRACARAQDQLTSTDWGPGIELFVRMGLHIGVDVAPRDGDYVALAVHQAARVTSAANGRQVLATNDVVMRCDDPALFADLGLFSVRDFDGPVRLFGLVRPNVPPASPRVPPAFDAQVPRYRTALVGRDADIAGILRQLEIAS